MPAAWKLVRPLPTKNWKAGLSLALSSASFWPRGSPGPESLQPTSATANANASANRTAIVLRDAGAKPMLRLKQWACPWAERDFSGNQAGAASYHPRALARSA
jgi:hypothetical protein